MRAVLDSNVLVSAFLFRDRGVPADILRHLAAGAFVHVTCGAILDEVEDVLLRHPEIVARYHCTPEVAAVYRAGVEATAVRAEVRGPFPAVSSDPGDDGALACALAGAAGYLVSGDHTRLSVGQYRGVRILTPREFPTVLEARDTNNKRPTGRWGATVNQAGNARMPHRAYRAGRPRARRYHGQRTMEPGREA